ncbi:hypothetical protein [Cohnella faecalis]|uniref:Uncharacterized protein n=1 Tax=Cohnella faecalis TaxID=2315694 RepID=A0A398CLJ7_9BACL|nr:hypothetical protein [Cohnella faecalis]RIE00501.1 hypothetical protein D3H35_28065 [Cohnella faecalis]
MAPAVIPASPRQFRGSDRPESKVLKRKAEKKPSEPVKPAEKTAPEPAKERKIRKELLNRQAAKGTSHAD